MFLGCVQSVYLLDVVDMKWVRDLAHILHTSLKYTLCTQPKTLPLHYA